MCASYKRVEEFSAVEACVADANMKLDTLSCYRDKRRQVGDTDCSKAVMAVVVLKTRTAFICSPGSQRGAREREKEGWRVSGKGEMKRESTQTACGSLSTSQ